MDRLVRLAATFFYVGEVPVAPGTAASFAGLLLVFATVDRPWLCAALFGLIALLGFLTAGPAEKIYGKKDPRQVVIDEVSGIFLVFFMVPVNWASLVTGFIVFRVLDVVKPFPARRLERLDGSWGIMADDLLCGLYANLILQVLFKTGLLRGGF